MVVNLMSSRGQFLMESRPKRGASHRAIEFNSGHTSGLRAGPAQLGPPHRTSDQSWPFRFQRTESIMDLNPWETGACQMTLSQLSLPSIMQGPDRKSTRLNSSHL